jgi:hypothetical protein
VRFYLKTVRVKHIDSIDLVDTVGGKILRQKVNLPVQQPICTMISKPNSKGEYLEFCIGDESIGERIFDTMIKLGN